MTDRGAVKRLADILAEIKHRAVGHDFSRCYELAGEGEKLLKGMR